MKKTLNNKRATLFPFLSYKYTFVLLSMLFIVSPASAMFQQVQNSSTLQENNQTDILLMGAENQSLFLSQNISGCFWVNYTAHYPIGSTYGLFIDDVIQGAANSSASPTLYPMNFCGQYSTSQRFSIKRVDGGSVSLHNFNFSYDFVAAPTITSPSNNSAQTSRVLNVTYTYTGTGLVHMQASLYSDFSVLLKNETSSVNYFNGTYPTGLIYVRLKGEDAANNSETNWTQIQVNILERLIGGSSWDWKNDLNVSLWGNVTYDKGDNNLLVGLLDSAKNSSTDNFNDGNHDWLTENQSDLSSAGNNLCFVNTSGLISAMVSNVNLTTFDISSGIKTNVVPERMGLASSVLNYSNANRNYWAYNHYYANNNTYFLYYTPTQFTKNNTLNELVAVGTWYMMRYQAYGNGSSKRGKMWVYGQSEPLNWENIETFPILPYGKVGASSGSFNYCIDNYWVKNADSSGNRIEVGNITYQINLSVNQTLKAIYSNVSGNVSVYVNTSNDTVLWTGNNLVGTNITSKDHYNVVTQNNQRYAQVTYQIYSNGSLQSPSDSRLIDFGVTVNENTPNISTVHNSYSNSNATNISIFVNTNITFTVTSNQYLNYFNWSSGAINSTGLTAYKNFTEIGNYSVSMYGSNENGSTQTVSWNISVYPYPIFANLTLREVWMKNTTEVIVNTSMEVDFVNLTLSRYQYWHLKPNETYAMNQTNTTHYSYSFSDLLDGIYNWSIEIKYNNSNSNYFLNNSTRIDRRIHDPLQNESVFIQIYKNNSYKLSMNRTNDVDSLYLEPAFSGFNITSYQYNVSMNVSMLKSCYNSSKDMWYNDLDCGSNASTDLVNISNVHYSYIFPVKRYVNASGYYVTYVEKTTIPDGYVFDKILGYARYKQPHNDEIVYINNSHINIGVHKISGNIVYVSIDNGPNVVNNYDQGRQIGSTYSDANNYRYYLTEDGWGFNDGWNPGSGSRPGVQPINSSILSQTNNSLRIYFRAIPYNVNWHNGLDANVDCYYTYNIVSELPAFNVYFSCQQHWNYTFVDMVAVQIPYVFLNANYNTYERYFLSNFTKSTFNVSYPDTYYSLWDQLLYVASYTNDTKSDGVGFWHWASPRYLVQNATIVEPATDQFSISYTYMTAQPVFTWTPDGYANNSVYFYFGNSSSIETFFEGMSAQIELNETVTPVNRSTNASDFNVLGNIYSEIVNATLFINNGTEYNYPMTISDDKLHVNTTISNITKGNYTFYLTANFSNGVFYSTNVMWVDFDIIAPASITSATAYPNFTHLNMSWVLPTDSDFDHVEFWNNSVLLGNLTNTSWNLSGSQGHTYNISTFTVDALGNVNGTPVWLNGTILSDSGTPAEPDVPCLNPLGACYYVATTGNDSNNGTYISTAWKNLSYAINRASTIPGIIIYVVNGTYYDFTKGSFTPTRSGNSTHPIIVTGYNHSTPIFYGNGTNIAFIEIGDSGYAPGSIDYITISNLSIHNYSYPIFIRNAGHILIENNTVSNSDDYFDQGDTIWIKEGSSNITIQNNTFWTSGYNSLDIDGSGGEVHDITAIYNNFSLNSVHWSLQFGTNATNITANYNTFSNTPYGQCLDTYIGVNGEFLRNYTIKGNVLNDCTLQGYDSSVNGTVEDNVIIGDGTFASIVGYGNYYNMSDRANDVTFRNNTQYNTNYEMYLTGGKNILLDRMNVTVTNDTFDSASDYYFRDMWDGGNITMRDTVTPAFGIRLKNMGNVTIEYTDNSIFTKTGGTFSSEVGVRYYNNKSNATQVLYDNISDSVYTIQKYDMNLTPNSGYLAASNNSTSINIDVLNQSISQINISIGTGLAKRFTIANSPMSYYSVRFMGNDTEIENTTVIGGTWNSTTVFGPDSYKILAGGSPSSSTYIPPTPATCTGTNGTNWINLNCTAGVGNITDALNYTDLDTLATQNTGFVLFNETGLSEGTLYHFRIYAYNNSGLQSLIPYYYNATTLTTPTTNPPNITSYSPTDLTPTIDVANLATFNAGSNQSVTWTWSGVTEGAGDGTPNSTATQTWTTTGAKTVTATCSNTNGSCGTIQWDVTVVSDGSGGGSDYDWLSGSCSPNGAIITTDPDVGSTTCAVGAYSFGYVFDRTGVGTYTIGMTKAGFTSYSAPLLFNEDHEILNIVLTSSVSPTGIYNLSGYIFNTSGYAMNNSTVRFSMQSVVTGPSGYYNFSGLSKQVNNVAADAPGYYMNFTQVTLIVNRTQNLTLTPKDDTMKTPGFQATILIFSILVIQYSWKRRANRHGKHNK